MARQRGRTWAVWGSAAQGCQVAWVRAGVGGRQASNQAPATSSWNSLRIANLECSNIPKLDFHPPPPQSQTQAGFLLNAMIIAADHL